MTTRERIIHLLHARGLSQTELAERVGIAYSTLRSYLDADSPRLPSVETAIKIARILEASTEWLWTDSDWPPPQSMDSSLLPDSVILEEALRRKAGARKALTYAIDRYNLLAKHLREYLQDGDLNPNTGPYWSAKSAWEGLEHSASIYGPMLYAWAKIEEVWASRDVLGRPEKTGGAEMQKVFELLKDIPNERTRYTALHALFNIWGIPEERIDAFARNMLADLP